MNSRRRQRMITITFLACVAVLLADRLVLSPAFRLYRDRAQWLRSLEVEVGRMQLLVEHADTWERRLAETQATALPDVPSAAEGIVIRSVREWAEKAGLTVTSMRPQWETRRGKPPMLALRLTGVGSLPAVTRFLYFAETAPGPIRTANTTIASAGANPRELSLAVEIQAMLWQAGAGTGGQDGAGGREMTRSSDVTIGDDSGELDPEEGAGAL